MKFQHLETIRSLAVVGATGIVGKEFLGLLTEHRLAIPLIKLLASEDSAGETMEVCDREVPVELLTAAAFEGIEVAFFSVPNDITRHFAPIAVKAGCIVVDDSSTFRMDPNVPLVIPEVNGAVLRDFSGLLMATPNCSTTPLAMVLKPFIEAYGLKRVVVSTYQSVSGAGTKAYQELSDQAAALLNGMPVEKNVFPHQIAFNCLPQIGPATDNGNCEEEEKVVRETRKILAMPDLKISATTVRVPTFCGHGLSVNIEFQKPFDSTEELREILDDSDGIQVLDKPENQIYPTNVEAIGSDPVFVGRLRRDYSVPSGINLWVISDNLRKGAALNSLQILETLYNYRRMV